MTAPCRLEATPPWSAAGLMPTEAAVSSAMFVCMPLWTVQSTTPLAVEALAAPEESHSAPSGRRPSSEERDGARSQAEKAATKLTDYARTVYWICRNDWSSCLSRYAGARSVDQDITAPSALPPPALRVTRSRRTLVTHTSSMRLNG